ncbi:MAG: ABC transporter substrate-binding protein [Firmicutes bacterium]|nr:ABC transporter substrate-binding protein [Bacillota bacterium]
MFFKETNAHKQGFIFIGAALIVLLISNLGLAATIVMGDFSWESVQVHNRIAGFILEHGYGHEIEYMFGESIPILLGLARGDVDVVTELWLDNLYEAVLEGVAAEEIISLGANYPDAPQGWYVPTYVIEGDPKRGIEAVAPDLKTVFDLKNYAHLFPDQMDRNKGRFYNAPTGWVAHDINNAKIEAYGLAETFTSFNTGSDAGLSTAILRAYDRGEPIVAYNWEPNWVVGLLDLTLLEEPAYDPRQWNDDFGTAYPASKVHIFVNSEFPVKAPRAAGFLANYNTTLEQTNEFLAYMEEENAGLEDVALWFLANNTETWQSWIIDQEIVEKVNKALAGELE